MALVRNVIATVRPAVLLAPLLPLLVGGCASPGLRTVLPAAVRDSCWAELAQPSLGLLASDELGARLVHDTGARELRWAPSRGNTPVDVKYGRITVLYDDNLRVARVSCG